MKIAFFGAALFCLTPYASAVTGLLLGLAFSLLFTNPFTEQSRSLAPKLLQISIVGLGAGMDLSEIAKAGLQGFGYTILSIGLTLILGLILGKIFRTDAETSLLLSVGTAICGGSAMAAIAPIIQAKPESVSFAMATVFLLNAAALFIFPSLGHLFGLSEAQFGLWSALAIHDTSSVVGAASHYGLKALELATTIKLARALWIVPMALVIGILWQRKDQNDAQTKIQTPWFILGFILMAGLMFLVPELKPIGTKISALARQILVLTLFLIGSGVSRLTLKKLGPKPLMQGFFLWAIVSSLSLVLITNL